MKPDGTGGSIHSLLVSRIASILFPTSSIDQDGRYTPSVSAISARATRPAMQISISPLIEQDSSASQPTIGATSSGPMGGYWEIPKPSAIRVTAPGAMMLLLTPCAAPSSAATLLSPIMPAFDTP